MYRISNNAEPWDCISSQTRKAIETSCGVLHAWVEMLRESAAYGPAFADLAENMLEELEAAATPDGEDSRA